MDEDGTGAESARDADMDRKFQAVFGITKDELRANGTDPDTYMAEHIHEALKDPNNQGILLPQSTIIRLRYFKEANTAYFWLFVTLGVLLASAIPHSHSVRQAVIYLAFVPLAAAAWGGFRQIRTARLYREACRAEGIEARLYRRRK